MLSFILAVEVNPSAANNCSFINLNNFFISQLTELKGGDVTGALCIKKPWPGMARTIYGDHQRFLQTYYKDFPGRYLRKIH